MKFWFALALVFSCLANIGFAKEQFPPSARQPSREGLKAVALLPIQASGRIKPFDTFAREGLELLVGKDSFEGRGAVEILLSLVFEAQRWENYPLIRIDFVEVKKELGLDVTEKYFSPQAISHSSQLMSLFTELEAKQKAQEKLDAHWQAVQRLGNQLVFLQELISGRVLRFVPPDPEAFANKTDAWTSLDALGDDMKLRFTLMAATFVNADPEIAKRFPEHVNRFQADARAKNPALYPQEFALKLEESFNRWRPFRWAFVAVLLSALLFSISFWSKSLWLPRLGMATYVLSLILLIYGLAVRSWLAGRPPVSNMYETIIWVAFGAMVFGLVFELKFGKKIFVIASGIFGTLGLLVADNVGMIMDDGIHPLEPVLRSNLWLTIHVLTITLSYAAFAVALVLGNIGLGQFVIWNRESASMPLKTLALYSYRLVQVGVVLLAAGTILGGVWADYSWGRFWGWDPKETWALIALLGYLALLHARFRGMLRAFGFLSGCVLAFMGVIMAWYGVNFVLGAGLHSYGFGSGGLSYMATYVSLQILFVAYAYYFYRRGQAVPT